MDSKEDSDLQDKMSKIVISKASFTHLNTTPIKEIYKITSKIGSGAYGEVRK